MGTETKIELGLIGIWVIGVLATAAFWVGVAWAAVHFIRKLW